MNPETVRKQGEGAAVMALGGTLSEAVHMSRGRVLNPAFSSYRVPRFTDLVDRRDLPPAGAGETPMIAVAPAMAKRHPRGDRTAESLAAAGRRR